MEAAPPPQSRGNLPVSLTRLIGREEETRQVAALLCASRLVTLVGPPGVGKTRLALHVGAMVAAEYPDGVWMVDLARQDEPSSVSRAVAWALSVRDLPEETVTEALVIRLSDKPALILLDNCEHVVDACAELASALLTRCPGLTVLATSRERLQIGGEAVWKVLPLTVPHDPRATIGELIRNPAVRLFLERAPDDFIMTEEVAPSIATICQRVDGLPLAVELAAGRIGSMSPAEVAAGLHDRFHLLTTSRRDLPPRHRALLAALESSHEGLSDTERVLYRRLSVFAGPFTHPAVEGVCQGEGLSAGKIVDALSELVGKSLVACDITGAQARHHVLDSVREHAREKLQAAGEEDLMRRAHARWLWEIAARGDDLAGMTQASWLQELEGLGDDVLAALAWSVRGGDPELGLDLAGSLVRFWLARGRLSEGQEWLQRAASLSGAAPAGRARALWGLGLMACLQGDLAAALAHAEGAVDLARASADERTLVRSLSLVGVCRIFSAPRASASQLAEATVLAREAGDTLSLAASLGMLGFAQALVGDLEVATETLHECVELTRAMGPSQPFAIGLVGMGYVMRHRGESDMARSHLEDGVAVARCLGDPMWTALALAFLGELAANQGDPAEGGRLAAEAEGIARQSGSRPILALCLTSLGHIHLTGGTPARAVEAFEQAVALAQAGGQRCLLGRALAGQGGARLLLGDHHSAEGLLAMAHEIAEETGERLLLGVTLQWLGQLAHAQGDEREAVGLHLEALRVRSSSGNHVGMATSLEAVANHDLRSGDAAAAARLFGSAASLRSRSGWRRTAYEQAAFEVSHTALQETMDAEERAGHWARGGRMSASEAVHYACRGRETRRRPSRGWASLTPAEGRVAKLVAEGLANAEVAERLFISTRTVQTHLLHIFRKLAITSRTQLACRLRVEEEAQ